jgi:putative peptidoglycan lipid II flippase
MKSNPPEKILHNVAQGVSPVNQVSGKAGKAAGQGEDSPHGGKHLIRAAGLLGFWTLCSRILGMVRDVVCAAHFGTSWQWDAFIYAFQLPNFFRRLVGEGALSAAFIPVYSETLAVQGEAKAFEFANRVGSYLTLFFGVLLVMTSIGLTLALGIPALSPTLALALDLMRIFFPFLCLMSFFALGMGVLNSHKHFLMPALGPVIINAFWIGGVFAVVGFTGPDLATQVRWLAWTLLASGVAELILMWHPLRRLGFRMQWIGKGASEELQKMFRLLIPSILGFAIVPLNVLVDMTLGLMIGVGANSSLWYGNRLMQFPLAMFAIAMGTALLPTLSQHVAQKDQANAERTMRFALKSVFLIILPCTVGLIVLRVPIVRLLFERGQFDAVSTARTAAVLFAYSVGLFAFSGQKILATGFYAHQDTKTPAISSVIALVTNIFLNLLFMVPFREAGLALATSVAGILQFFILWRCYQKQCQRLDMADIGRFLIKVIFAAGLMGILCHIIYQGLAVRFPGDGTGAQALHVFGSISISTFVYFGLCLMFRVSETYQLVARIFRKLKPAP